MAIFYRWPWPDYFYVSSGFLVQSSVLSKFLMQSLQQRPVSTRELQPTNQVLGNLASYYD